jgi:hypothetical protein
MTLRASGICHSAIPIRRGLTRGWGVGDAATTAGWNPQPCTSR